MIFWSVSTQLFLDKSINEWYMRKLNICMEYISGLAASTFYLLHFFLGLEFRTLRFFPDKYSTHLEITSIFHSFCSLLLDVIRNMMSQPLIISAAQP